MADWGMGASSEKQTAPVRQVRQVKFLVCEKCGYEWTYVYVYPSQLREIQGPRGGHLCEKCRGAKKEVKHTPHPPPVEMQMTIEEKYGTKK